MLQDNMKILHIGDIHLERQFNSDSIVGKDFSLRREELWETFEKALEYAKTNGIHIVLISGDIYENESITVSNLDRLAYLFEKYAPIKFFLAMGNHDYLSEKSSYLNSIISSNVFIFGKDLSYVEVEENIRIYGFSWSKVEYLNRPFEYLKLDESYKNILLLHGMVGYESNYLPINLKELEALKFDYVALGHIHTPSKMGENIYYSGALEPLSFNNLGEHGGYELNFRNNSLNIKFIDFAKRSYRTVKLDITDIDNNKELFKRGLESLKDFREIDYIKVLVVGEKNSNIDFNQLEIILLNKFPFIKVIDETERKIDFESVYNNNKNNILGKYFDYVNENYQGLEREILIDLALKSFPLEDKLEN